MKVRFEPLISFQTRYAVAFAQEDKYPFLAAIVDDSLGSVPNLLHVVCWRSGQESSIRSQAVIFSGTHNFAMSTVAVKSLEELDCSVRGWPRLNKSPVSQCTGVVWHPDCKDKPNASQDDCRFLASCRKAWCHSPFAMAGKCVVWL